MSEEGTPIFTGEQIAEAVNAYRGRTRELTEGGTYLSDAWAAMGVDYDGLERVISTRMIPLETQFGRGRLKTRAAWAEGFITALALVGRMR